MTETKAKIIPVPFAFFYALFGVLELASKIGWVKGGSSRAQFRWKHKRVTFDGSKLTQELGWQPKVSMEEGLKRTFDWYVHHCKPR